MTGDDAEWRVVYPQERANARAAFLRSQGYDVDVRPRIVRGFYMAGEFTVHARRGSATPEVQR